MTGSMVPPGLTPNVLPSEEDRRAASERVEVHRKARRDRAYAVLSWEGDGYVVADRDCSECGSLVVRKPGWSRWVCTNHGGCEFSVG